MAVAGTGPESFPGFQSARVIALPGVCFKEGGILHRREDGAEAHRGTEAWTVGVQRPSGARSGDRLLYCIVYLKKCYFYINPRRSLMQ